MLENEAKIVPNFFIIGAPKCGTTALSEYLRSHPKINFSNPKEPYFFCTDFSEKQRPVKTWEEYAQCFENPENSRILVGEGSAGYLYSTEAVPNILKQRPEAKFIVMVRNPTDMLYSMHSQFVYDCIENLVDFQKAWDFEDERRRGNFLPSNLRERKFLYYSDVGRLGEQVRRLYSIVSLQNIQVVVFDDFISDTRKVYLEILDFLDLPDDGRVDFPKVNSNKVYRSDRLANFLSSPPTFFQVLKSTMKKVFNTNRLGLLKPLYQLNQKQVERLPLTDDFKHMLTAYFVSDIKLLEETIDRDLSNWMK